MPASIVHIDTAEERDDHRSVERQLADAFYEYWRAGDNHNSSDPDYAYASFLERRIRTLELSIRRLLSSGVLTQDQRTGLLVAVYGSKTGTLKDANLLTDAEAQLLGCYRGTDTAGRAALRGVLHNLAKKGGER
jgi:hypothetical protein